MNNIIKILLVINMAWRFILAMAILLSVASGQYNHNPSSYRNQTWMSLLDNGIPLRKMSLIGSHSSMGVPGASGWGDIVQTQANSLQVQMEMGMRALDIRCNHANNQFRIQDRGFSLGVNFDQVMVIVQTFLTTYPTETILMHIVEEDSPSGNSETFQQTFIKYKIKYSTVFWAYTTQTPLLGDVRGRVVVIQDFNGNAIHGLLYSTFTSLPHKWMTTNWDLYGHWTDIKSFLAATSASGDSRIAFWSGHGGSFPYFVASGKSSPNGGLLATGATSPGWKSSWCADFPRVACFIGICTIAFQGVNILGFNYIGSQNYKYVGILFLDFIGDNLLTKAVSMNTGAFVKCTATQLGKGCTYCNSSVICLGCNTTSFYVYDPVTATCSAANGYYLLTINSTNNIPTSCSTPMIGCLSCSSGSVCTACDTFANYALINSTCAAAIGYYLDATSIPVKCTLTGCAQCTSATVCTVCSTPSNYALNVTTSTCYCDPIKNFMQSPTSPACICVAGFFLSSNNTCDPMPLCPALASGCVTCNTSVPACLVCNTTLFFVLSSPYCLCQNGYFYDGFDCTECNLTMPACDTCVSTEICLTCINNFTMLGGTCVCKPQYFLLDSDTCLFCPIGCLDCDNMTDCDTCDTANSFTLISGICECNTGMFLQGTSCVPCSSMAGCTACVMTGCTICNAIFGFHLNTTSQTCYCLFGYFVNPMQVCEACSQLGCLNCISSTQCIQCDTTLFYLANGICNDICGDGLLYTLPCDDGNVIDGDGCSSTCQVQTGFTCVGGTRTTPSICSYSGPIYITIITFIKDPTSNSISLIATISPLINAVTSLDFNSVIVPNFAFDSKTTTFDPVTGKISINYNYNQSLNTQTLAVSFQPPTDQPQYINMQTVSASIPSISDNNLALKYYPPEYYANLPLVTNLIDALGYLVIATFILSVFLISKLIGIEMIFIYQVAYCGLIMITKLECYMDMLKNLWFVNGYNQLLQFFSDNSSGSYTDNPMPSRISEINYHMEFLTNFNIDIVLCVLPLLLGAIIFIIAKIRSNKQWKIKYSYPLLKQWFFTALLFVQMHLIFSMSLSIYYGIDKIIGIVIGGLLVLSFITSLVLFIIRPKHYGEYKTFFGIKKHEQVFYVVTVVYRFSLGIIMVIAADIPFGIYIALGISGAYMMAVIIIRPYKTNIRPIINSIIISLVLGFICWSKINEDTTDVTFLTSNIALILIGLLYAAFIFNFICLLVRVIRKCRKNKKDQQLQNKDFQLKEFDKEFIHNLKEQLQVLQSSTPMGRNNMNLNDMSDLNLTARETQINPHKELMNKIKKIEILNGNNSQAKINESQEGQGFNVLDEVDQSSEIQSQRERSLSDSQDMMIFDKLKEKIVGIKKSQVQSNQSKE